MPKKEPSNEEVLDRLILYWNGKITEIEITEYFDQFPRHRPHGEIVDIVEGVYGEWFVYEDGYEEFFSRD